MVFKQLILNHIKNIYGTRAKNKFLVFAIDDYGNIRTHSKNALESMLNRGSKIVDRFDAYDHLETSEDLEALYDTLSKFKDEKSNNVAFSPLAMSGNINFDAMRKNGYTRYEYENLTETFKKLETFSVLYKGTLDLIREGIDKGIFCPEFHGREHLNLKVFNNKLNSKDKEQRIALEHNSYSCISASGSKNIGYTAAFEFDDLIENDSFEPIVMQGLIDFKKVYGYNAKVFNPPGGREHPRMHKFLKAGGIKYLETPWVKNEHQGSGKYKRVINYSGKKNHLGMIYSVRNCVFEPTFDRGFDWVDRTFKQIDTAFKLNKPAIVSSHRANYCGLIDEENRKKGLSTLEVLIKKVQKYHPDVEFISLTKLLESLYEN